MMSSRSVMIINPKDRASDYMKAYQMLRQEKSTAKVYFELANGKQIANIIDITPMPEGTMILFRYTTPQGIKYQVVDIEDILAVKHL